MTESYFARLARPEAGRIADAVLDTDTYNEIDDQFALCYALRSADKINLKAVTAAPFLNERSDSPGDGMEKSYEEINRLLSIGKFDYGGKVLRGSKNFLPDEKTALSSDAASYIAELASKYSPESPLYVMAIGAITNVASAILLDPGIIDRIVVIWLGGHSYQWPDTKEFNLWSDVAAARAVFASGAAIMQLPCMGVVSGFSISRPEIEKWLIGKNKLCDYLAEITIEHQGNPESEVWTKVIWDVTAPAWLTGNHFIRDYLAPCPMPEYSGHYSFSNERRPIKCAYWVNRDALMRDLLTKLQV